MPGNLTVVLQAHFCSHCARKVHIQWQLAIKFQNYCVYVHVVAMSSWFNYACLYKEVLSCSNLAQDIIVILLAY